MTLIRCCPLFACRIITLFWLTHQSCAQLHHTRGKWIKFSLRLRLDLNLGIILLVNLPSCFFPIFVIHVVTCHQSMLLMSSCVCEVHEWNIQSRFFHVVLASYSQSAHAPSEVCALYCANAVNAVFNGAVCHSFKVQQWQSEQKCTIEKSILAKPLKWFCLSTTHDLFTSTNPINFFVRTGTANHSETEPM